MTDEAWLVAGSLSAGVAEEDGVASFHLSGELDLEGASAVEQRLLRALETHSRLVLDLSGLTFMDSAGIAALVRTKNAAHKRDAQLVVRLGEATAVRRVLDLVGLTEFLDVGE